MAASRASYFLSKNNDALQKSLDRLSSGKRITQPSDDAGGLAVSMKLQGEIDTLKGAANNVANAISFLQVQDGILESVANVVSRLSELKSLSTDVLKSDSDIETYNSEAADLAAQLTSFKGTKFNGVFLFGDTAGVGGSGGTLTVTGTASIDVTQTTLNDTLTSTTGSLNITTIDSVDETVGAAAGTYTADFTSVQITEILSNIATARATNGGEAKRLQFEQQNIATQISNLEAANGRIMDVDIAAETTNLAKQQILVQASASMVAQANSANQVALMLLQ
jgi:flagellin